jgi:hypothetical protein
VDRDVDAGSAPIEQPVSVPSRALEARDVLVTAILIVAGVFDWLSGNPIHSTLLFAAAVALVWNGFGRRGEAGVTAARSPGPTVRPPVRVPVPVLLAAAALFSFVVGGFGRYSWPATVAVIVPCASALAIAWRRPDAESTAARPLDLRGVIPWLSLVVAAGLFELANLFLQPTLKTDSYAHPTFSVMTDPALASHPGRSVVLFLWLALGWFLMQR